MRLVYNIGKAHGIGATTEARRELGGLDKKARLIGHRLGQLGHQGKCLVGLAGEFERLGFHD